MLVSPVVVWAGDNPTAATPPATNNSTPANGTGGGHSMMNHSMMDHSMMDHPMFMYGRVVSCDPGAHQLTLMEGTKQRTVTLDDTAVITLDGKATTLKELKPDQYVSIRRQKNGEHQEVVHVSAYNMGTHHATGG